MTVVMTEADQAQWLVDHRWEMDRGEAAWLEQLAEFDRAQGWAYDGQLSCVDWLMWRMTMARSTAFEKLRIAHELRRRPLVREAFADGRLSYSAARAITRIDDVDPDVDSALIDLAGSGTITDVERMVRCYQLHAEQERLPRDPDSTRGVRLQRFEDGFGRVEALLTDIELAEFSAALQAFLDLSAAPSSGPVDESSAEDSPAGAPWPVRRADALMEMARTALAHAGEGHAAGADRYMVHLVRRESGPELADGTPISEAEALRIECDCSVVEQVVGAGGEPLYLGRKSRTWSTAQRRAILIRDGWRCRFPGCNCRDVDIHHISHWEEGGTTDISNGIPGCRQHHTKLHGGYRVDGDANGVLRFYRPDGSVLGSS